MVKEDRRAFPSSSSELDDDDDAELVRKKLVKPNLRWKDSQFQDQTLAALNQMRKHRHFCDVTLQVFIDTFLLRTCLGNEVKLTITFGRLLTLKPVVDVVKLFLKEI